MPNECVCTNVNIKIKCVCVYVNILSQSFFVCIYSTCNSEQCCLKMIVFTMRQWQYIIKEKNCPNESKREGLLRNKRNKKSVTNLTDKQKFEGTRFFIVQCKQTFFFLQSAKNLIVYERKCSLYVIMCWCTCFLSIRK